MLLLTLHGYLPSDAHLPLQLEILRLPRAVSIEPCAWSSLGHGGSLGEPPVPSLTRNATSSH